MKAPVHHWKEHVTYADGRPSHWTFDGKPCWFASGLRDKNGVEIFEGDIVQLGDNRDDTFPIIFEDAAFWLGDNEYFLYHFDPSELEIVGHITEEQS